MVARKVARKTKVEGLATSAKAETQETRVAGFPIIGLGASAGGLEAFEQFFRRVPRDSGMAFVLVPHLDPSHASLLTEILQRTTVMPVAEAQDRMTVAPNSVYVIPPNRDMAIFHGALQLRVPEQPRGHRMPIDAFLRSLAEDQGEHAVGVVLSGTGTDGTLGLRSILGAGGVSFVQEPASAKYDGMPVSAIQAGYATYVLPAETMPEVLLSGMRSRAVRQTMPPAAAGGLNRVLLQLRSVTGHDFSQYKKSTVGRRIERRMSRHDIDDIDVYARYLREHPAEVHALFKELLINVTSFFRDAEAFDTLKQEILPHLFAGKPGGYVFRVWVPAGATGEEAYSIAILLREFMDETGRDFKVQLYSTDLDEDVIVTARAGTYPPNIVQDVSPERLRRFFLKEEAGYRVKKEIREMVVFATQNVIKDPPFTKLDLLSCRNVMIYLEPEIQGRLITTFHFALKPGGVLFLSPSENIGSHTDRFAPLSRKWKLYGAIHSVASLRPAMVDNLPWAADPRDPTPAETVKKAEAANSAELTKRVLLQSYAPASVLTDLKGNILYVYGDTGKYLRPAPGQATLNVVEMARDDLRRELGLAVRSAAGRGAPVLNRELSVKTRGRVQAVRFSVRPLSGLVAGEELLLVSFQDVTRSAPGQSTRQQRAAGSAAARRYEELERDLAYTRENLQATIEEQQASNEELMSMNEELQSTNEELVTSQEELQSVNEELVTVNAQLEAKIEQLASMQNDMKNLLDNISVGTVFLDKNLVIRRFTHDAALVYRLVATDVGRHLGDIKSNLEGEDLLADAQAVLKSLVPCERELRTADGAWYLARILPYRTLDDVIDGVVLTFTDISKRVESEAAVQEAREMAEGIVDTVREPLVVLDGTLKMLSASRSFYRAFRIAPEEAVGRPIYELGNRQLDIPALRELLETVLPRDRSFNGYAVDYDLPVVGRRKILLNARRIVRKTPDDQLILLALELPLESEASA